MLIRQTVRICICGTVLKQWIKISYCILSFVFVFFAKKALNTAKVLNSFIPSCFAASNRKCHRYLSRARSARAVTDEPFTDTSLTHDRTESVDDGSWGPGSRDASAPFVSRGDTSAMITTHNPVICAEQKHFVSCLPGTWRLAPCADRARCDRGGQKQRVPLRARTHWRLHWLIWRLPSTTSPASLSQLQSIAANRGRSWWAASNGVSSRPAR